MLLLLLWLLPLAAPAATAAAAAAACYGALGAQLRVAQLKITAPYPLLPHPPLPAGLPQQVLQLWHRSNWHWYCKAERRSRCCAALHAAWDAAASGSDLSLHLVTAEGDYQQVRGVGLLRQVWLHMGLVRLTVFMW